MLCRLALTRCEQRHSPRGSGRWNGSLRLGKQGTTRFDRDGEALFAARLNGVLAGIGGLTMEPVVPGALRMRRFYLRPAFRRIGVGRRLVTALLAGVDGERSITVNAGPTSIAFWERLGFNPDPRDGHTHILRRASV
jgi:GNAT superfamily N-acetyltransferase